ncbi:ADP-ribosylation_factor [Hexamita inflata]|uniref:ADP-ribosylation factor n=1 Tax=Hexamita inflata TaxID=28002 RepID=A0AA86TCM5_9EUKA|nr:ADP-ribosylation factor [Hexamita inflata]
MYVVDSTDRDFNRLQQCRYELYKLLNYQELADIPFMIIFNKTDLANAMNNEEIQEYFNLTIGLQQIVTATTHKVLAVRTSSISNKCAQEIIRHLKNIVIG